MVILCGHSSLQNPYLMDCPGLLSRLSSLTPYAFLWGLILSCAYDSWNLISSPDLSLESQQEYPVVCLTSPCRFPDDWNSAQSKVDYISSSPPLSKPAHFLVISILGNGNQYPSLSDTWVSAFPVMHPTSKHYWVAGSPSRHLCHSSPCLPPQSLLLHATIASLLDYCNGLLVT